MKEGISSKSGVPPKKGVFRFWRRATSSELEGQKTLLRRAASRVTLWWPTSHCALYRLYIFY
jgi:hypothetical protein